MNSLQGIRLVLFDEKGRFMGRASVDTNNPRAAWEVMETALTHRKAVDAGIEVSPETLYRSIMGREPPPRPRSAFEVIGRFMAAKWRVAVRDAEDDEDKVTKRLRKQGIPAVVARLVLKGWK